MEKERERKRRRGRKRERNRKIVQRVKVKKGRLETPNRLGWCFSEDKIIILRGEGSFSVRGSNLPTENKRIYS